MSLRLEDLIVRSHSWMTGERYICLWALATLAFDALLFSEGIPRV